MGIDDCCTLCDETEGCMGFVYYWQTCYLKGGTIGTFNNTGRISRVRRVEPKCSDFEAEANNTDLGGELLSSVWMDGDATIDDCCPLCDNTEGCMGFVYYWQTCHLKGGSSLSTYENAGRISRVRSPCSGFEPTELGKDVAGDMLYDFAAQLPAQVGVVSLGLEIRALGLHSPHAGDPSCVVEGANTAPLQVAGLPVVDEAHAALRLVAQGAAVVDPH